MTAKDKCSSGKHERNSCDCDGRFTPPPITEQPVAFAEGLTNHSITFHRKGKLVGTFDFNASPATFVGDVDESAKVFAESVLTQWDGMKYGALRKDVSPLLVRLRTLGLNSVVNEFIAKHPNFK